MLQKKNEKTKKQNTKKNGTEVKGNYFYTDNFGQWLLDNFIPLKQLNLALFADNPEISGYFSVYNNDDIVIENTTDSVIFTGVLYCVCVCDKHGNMKKKT